MPALNQLEFYAHYIWPAQRLVAKVSRRCSRCILSEKCSPLQDGVCEHCRATKTEHRTDITETAETVVGLNEFSQEVEAQIGKGRSRYDALLLLSGGKDSAYVLHKMRTTFPTLRILCLTVDNGFMNTTDVISASANPALTRLSTAFAAVLTSLKIPRVSMQLLLSRDRRQLGAAERHAGLTHFQLPHIGHRHDREILCKKSVEQSESGNCCYID